MASRKKPGGRSGTSSRGYWFLGVLVAVVVLGAALYTNASQSAEGRPVTQFTHLHGLAAPGWAPGELFVSTHEGLIHVDTERNWRFVSRQAHDFMGFQAHPSEEGVLYSSGHPAPGSNLPNPIGFMVSEDAGVTWEPRALQGQVDFHTMTAQPTNGDVIYGFSGGLYRSLDAGHTWEQVPAPTLTQAGGAFAFAVHPEDADTVLAGTRAGLLRSTDGGRSWEQLNIPAVVTAIAFSPHDSSRVLAYGASPETGLLVSDDAGETWTPTGFVLEGQDAIGYIAVHPTDPETFYLGSYNQNLYETTDAGASWTMLAEAGVPSNP
jgi:hypothetical protein